MVDEWSKFGFCGVVCCNVVSSKYDFLPKLFVTVSKGEYTYDNYYIMMNIKEIVFLRGLIQIVKIYEKFNLHTRFVQLP